MTPYFEREVQSVHVYRMTRGHFEDGSPAITVNIEITLDGGDEPKAIGPEVKISLAIPDDGDLRSVQRRAEEAARSVLERISDHSPTALDAIADRSLAAGFPLQP